MCGCENQVAAGCLGSATRALSKRSILKWVLCSAVGTFLCCECHQSSPGVITTQQLHNAGPLTLGTAKTSDGFRVSCFLTQRKASRTYTVCVPRVHFRLNALFLSSQQLCYRRGALPLAGYMVSANYTTSLRLSFLIYKMEIVKVPHGVLVRMQ